MCSRCGPLMNRLSNQVNNRHNSIISTNKEMKYVKKAVSHYLCIVLCVMVVTYEVSFYYKPPIFDITK